MVAALKTGPWKLGDIASVPKNGFKVFSCFHCGGGSSMGYKLAGYEVLGGVEIDPEMMAVYRKNHHPKHSFLMGVQQFGKLPDDQIPGELFDLDILDGSPPCSVFSTAGAREKKWGGEHHFREGQSAQKLDDLFFDFIEIARRLQPKVVVAENVSGLIKGQARGFVKGIFAAFSLAGYDAQLFLLNASAMGVPQRRERTFFLAKRKNLSLPKIELSFSEKAQTASAAVYGAGRASAQTLRPSFLALYDKTPPGKDLGFAHPKGSFFTRQKLHPDKPSNTLTADAAPIHWSEKRHMSDGECLRLQTFPDDYDALETKIPYLCGMSVPPFMMQRVALQIEKQWLRR